MLALKEYGDRVGEACTYQTSVMKTCRLKFEVTIRFQGQSYTSTEKSKKEARQLAAQKACRTLSIKVHDVDRKL